MAMRGGVLNGAALGNQSSLGQKTRCWARLGGLGAAATTASSGTGCVIMCRAFLRWGGGLRDIGESSFYSDASAIFRNGHDSDQ